MANLSHHRALVRHWNAGVDRISGWPNVTLTEPPYVKRFTGPSLEDFPQGLRDDIDAYCEHLGKRHRTVSGKIRRPCKQSTIDMRRRELVAAVRAAVEAGIPLAELRSLRNLLRPDRAEIIIEFYWEKNGERPSLYTIDLASKLLALARSEALSDAEIGQLDEIRIALEQYRTTGLTEKNRKLIRQIAQSDVWREVVRLPQRLMAEARANFTSLSSKRPLYQASDTLVLDASTCDARLLDSRPNRVAHLRLWLLDPSHRRPRFWFLKRSLFRAWRICHHGDRLARPTNCLKIIFLVDPSLMRGRGI